MQRINYADLILLPVKTEYDNRRKNKTDKKATK